MTAWNACWSILLLSTNRKKLHAISEAIWSVSAVGWFIESDAAILFLALQVYAGRASFDFILSSFHGFPNYRLFTQKPNPSHLHNLAEVPSTLDRRIWCKSSFKCALIRFVSVIRVRACLRFYLQQEANCSSASLTDARSWYNLITAHEVLSREFQQRVRKKKTLRLLSITSHYAYSLRLRSMSSLSSHPCLYESFVSPWLLWRRHGIQINIFFH